MFYTSTMVGSSYFKLELLERVFGLYPPANRETDKQIKLTKIQRTGTVISNLFYLNIRAVFSPPFSFHNHIY